MASTYSGEDIISEGAQMSRLHSGKSRALASSRLIELTIVDPDGASKRLDIVGVELGGRKLCILHTSVPMLLDELSHEVWGTFDEPLMPSLERLVAVPHRLLDRRDLIHPLAHRFKFCEYACEDGPLVARLREPPTDDCVAELRDEGDDALVGL